MNIWIFSSGIIGLLTTGVHIFAGQIEPVRPFLRSELDAVSKATLLACWHITSVTLFATSLLLTYVGWADITQLYTLVAFIGALYSLYFLVFVAVGLYFFKARTLMKLPQWTLLLPIGLLALFGAMQA